MDEARVFTITVSPEDARRLERLSDCEGKDLGTLLSLAVEEFLERWEDYYRTVDLLEAEEDLKAVVRVADST